MTSHYCKYCGREIHLFGSSIWEHSESGWMKCDNNGRKTDGKRYPPKWQAAPDNGQKVVDLLLEKYK